MSRSKIKEKAIHLRKKGLSYSQIKAELGVSKSTLSRWLSDMPLPLSRIKALQKNERVIEKIRVAKQRTRERRLQNVLTNVTDDIGKITQRELFIAGLFLYWAEGGKTTKYAISLSNTDPAMIRFFIIWLHYLGVPEEKMIVKLHLYADVDIDTETKYWRREIGIPMRNFRKPYVKKSKLSELSYVSRSHGTCNIIVNGRDIAEYVQQGLVCLRAMY